MASDPEALYQEVLQEEQGKGVSAPVAEGRAKAARARAEQGSPHPKEPKWWPGAQPHLEGDGAAPAEAEPEEAEEPAAEEPVEEPAAPAAEAAPAETPAAPTMEPAADPSEAPAAPAAATAPQPAAAAAAQAPAATATQAPVQERPSGVTHGMPAGNRLRPEDSVGTDAQFDAQRAVYDRRKMIDELVATGVPAVAAEAGGRRSSPLVLLLYLVIPLVAIAILVGQQESLGGGGGGAPPAPPENGGGGELTVSAENVQFDTDAISLTAGEATPVHFVNADASSVQHNISIYVSEGGEALFEGEIIPGGQEITYEVPALEPGENYFQCDVHPGMNGTVTVE